MTLLLLPFVSLGLCIACVRQPAQSLDPRALVTIAQRGGHCAEGVCSSRTVIRADGAVLRDGVRRATLSAADIAHLTQLIASTDFATVRAVRPPGPPPFAGCQSAVDGSDVTYRITTRTGVEDVDGCATAIDFHAPLFAFIDTLLASASAPPAT